MRDPYVPQEPIDCSFCGTERFLHAASRLTLFASTLLLGALVVITAVQYDGFAFDRPADLYPDNTSVIEWGGWALENQRLRFAASVIALALVLGAVLCCRTHTRSSSSAERVFAVLLFAAVWPLLAILLMDCRDVNSAIRRYCSLANVSCRVGQYVTTCVLDAFCMFFVLLASVFLFALSLASKGAAKDRADRQSEADASDFDQSPAATHSIPPLPSPHRSRGQGSPSSPRDDPNRRREEARRTLQAVRPVIGIRSETGLYSPGILVTEVFPSSPASRGGLLAGDIIHSLAGYAADSHPVFKGLVERAFPGETAEFAVERGARDMAVQIIFGGMLGDMPLGTERLIALRAAAGAEWVRAQEVLTSAAGPGEISPGRSDPVS